MVAVSPMYHQAESLERELRTHGVRQEDIKVFEAFRKLIFDARRDKYTEDRTKMFDSAMRLVRSGLYTKDEKMSDDILKALNDELSNTPE